MIQRKYKIGIIGTGFIARGLIYALRYYPQLEVGGVLTRRQVETIKNFPIGKKYLTNDINQLIKTSDLVVECSGDVIHGTEMINKVFAKGLPVVTMNADLQVVTGSALAKRGQLLEAEGDQPGSLAALDSEIRLMGFKPIVYGNIKRFLNLDPTEEEMQYWAKQQGISLTQVTAFTDGTKVQIEQALVANGLGATITDRNLSGIVCKDFEDGAHQLGELAEQIGQPISDYVLSSTGPAGVFIVAKHSGEQRPYLEYLKLGKGPYYILTKPYHLCHLEIPKTILNVLTNTNDYHFNNGDQPTINVAAVAKHSIPAGEKIKRGSGSFAVRGEAVKIQDEPTAVPIGLLCDATFINPINAGQIITFADVKLPETLALQLWQETIDEPLPKKISSPFSRLKEKIKVYLWL